MPLSLSAVPMACAKVSTYMSVRHKSYAADQDPPSISGWDPRRKNRQETPERPSSLTPSPNVEPPVLGRRVRRAPGRGGLTSCPYLCHRVGAILCTVPAEVHCIHRRHAHQVS